MMESGGRDEAAIISVFLSTTRAHVRCDLQLRTTDQSYRDPSTRRRHTGNCERIRPGKKTSTRSGVPFLAGGVPDLGLDDLIVDVDAAGGELDADGGLGVEAELVAREAREQVGLADARVADEHHLEEVVVVVVRPVRHPP
jgi:hypothetical protein